MNQVRCSSRVAVAVALAMLAMTTRAAAPAGFVETYKSAMEAYAAKDFAAMEARLRAALVARPNHPTALYNLAVAVARQGDAERALDGLEHLARMGLAYEPGRDKDFEALGDHPRFAALVRRFAELRKPAGNAAVMFQIHNPRFIPEGIAYDDEGKSYFVGGVHERAIVRIGSSLTASDFVMQGAGGLLAPLGMQADVRRRLLWVVHAGIPEMENPDPKDFGRSGILAFDLATGRVKRRAMLPDDGRKHRLGDLVLLPGGTIYATDSEAALLYHFNPTRGTFTPRTVPGQLVSPQGLTLSADRKTLYVADYTQGLFAYDLDSGTLAPVTAHPDVCVYGIDGLYRHDNDLIAIQNGITPHRVVRLRLDDTGRHVKSARVLAANLPEFDEPTLGVVVKSGFYFIANSQWNRFDKNHRLPPEEQLRSPVVMRLSLDE